MTIPWPGGPQPQQQVGPPDPSVQLSQGLTNMSRQLMGLQQAISAQTQMMQRSINAQQRYQAGGGHGGSNVPMNPQVVAAAQAAGIGLGGPGMQQVTGVGATTSSANMRTYLAQQIGQWIAGTPLYGNQGAGGAGGGGGGNPHAPAGPPVPPNPQSGLAGALFGAGQHGTQSPRAQAGATILQNLGAQVAASGGSPAGIMGALRSIPGIGMLVDSANSAANTYLTQREAGRMYQNVEGGSNLGAQTERLHSLAYQASMFGRMPSGAAAQAFGAVTQMGYTQRAANEGGELQNRQSALNFIYHNYTSTGMDVNESVQVLQTASQNAQVNLTQLSTTLNTLSDAAGKAGTNAETARQQFNSYFGTALGQGMGTGASGVAQGVSQMQAMMGKQMAGVNFSGELSQQSQYLLSGMSGMTPAQIQYLQRTNPGAYNQLKASQNTQFLQMGGLMTPAMQASLKGMISKAGGTAALQANPDLTQQIASQFLNQWQVKGNINENLWAQEISSLTGVPMNANQAFDWIVSQSGGINEASANKTLATNRGANVSAGNIGSAPTGKYGLATGSQGNLLEQVATLGLGGHAASWQQALTAANSAAASPYLATEKTSGQRSPVLESLIQNTSSATQVAVQTATGTRVMSIGDAMKYYPQELAAGNVQFYGANGQALGNTAALTGGLVNTGASTAAEQKQKAGSTLGSSLAAWQKAHPASSGSVTNVFDLSADAKQLLKLLPGNNDQAAATSTVPANTYASQASR
jgi:hypothetical protein